MRVPPRPNAAEARQLLANGAFALMLCDVTMPGESGFTLLSHVNEAHPDVAVIMVTAVDSPHVPDPASTLGTYGYILKPFDTNVILINVVGALLQRAQKLAARCNDSQSQSDISSHVAELGEIVDRLYHEDREHLWSREGTAPAGRPGGGVARPSNRFASPPVEHARGTSRLPRRHGARQRSRSFASRASCTISAR